jgi:hypothetical protein
VEGGIRARGGSGALGRGRGGGRREKQGRSPASPSPEAEVVAPIPHISRWMEWSQTQLELPGQLCPGHTPNPIVFVGSLGRGEMGRKVP